MNPVHEVADVLRHRQHRLRELCANSWQLRTLQALSVCRTAALGGHIDVCNKSDCKKIHISYNSCRNRHCPRCQGHKGEEWMQSREKELFRTSYYHLVFTLPEALNPLALYRPKQVYSLLFATAWQVVNGFARNPKFIGAAPGMIAILHTWGQNLSLHPHLHCIVPGGGVTTSGKWKAARGKNKFLFPVKAMSKVFRAKYVQALRTKGIEDAQLYKNLFSKPWVVYCKQPFFGPQQVVEYLGRYTHKIAISNHRIRSIENGKVTFTAKDYRKGGKKYPLTLSEDEFIRRFSLHILPRGFTRIRHYGILSSTLKKVCIELLQQELGKPDLPERTDVHLLCPVCRKGKLVTIWRFHQRGPPPMNDSFLNLLMNLEKKS
ncbi:MAG: IS91 family transposase [Candidatus Aminicenantes bacterium]|nr:IS91 family transposase [Candidatus Aminicenantes bacterium]